MTVTMQLPESIRNDYRDALAELTQNNKPRINVLTMLAEENADYGEAIVEIIESHINQVR